DVGLWLDEINLGGYRQVFKENGVNGEYLESMSVFTTEQILRFIRRCHVKWGDFITLCKELRRIKAIERLAIEASIIVDSCVHMLSNKEPKLTSFVNKMKALKSEVVVLTHTVSELVQEFMGVKKPDKINVKNPSGVTTKGREKQKRMKGKHNADVLYSVGVIPGGGDHGDGGPRDDGPRSVLV
ncbi:sterile alpha motif domain-containing protein, partial [Tanacetum coccineum]